MSGGAQQQSAKTGGTLKAVILGKTQLNPASPAPQGAGGARRCGLEEGGGGGPGDALSGFWSLQVQTGETGYVSKAAAGGSSFLSLSARSSAQDAPWQVGKPPS